MFSGNLSAQSFQTPAQTVDHSHLECWTCSKQHIKLEQPHPEKLTTCLMEPTIHFSIHTKMSLVSVLRHIDLVFIYTTYFL